MGLTLSEMKSNSPKVPPYTCDFIDPVIGHIRTAYGATEELHRGSLSDVGEYMEKLLGCMEILERDIDEQLEKLRNMNNDLREGSEYWYGCSKALWEELQEAKLRIKDMEDAADVENAAAAIRHRDGLVMENGSSVIFGESSEAIVGEGVG